MMAASFESSLALQKWYRSKVVEEEELDALDRFHHGEIWVRLLENYQAEEREMSFIVVILTSQNPTHLSFLDTNQSYFGSEAFVKMWDCNYWALNTSYVDHTDYWIILCETFLVHHFF